jgi:putative acetyltransferase
MPIRHYQNFLIRPWLPTDRDAIAEVIGTVLQEYGLSWDPMAADRDAVEVETYYLQSGGDFWVILNGDERVGSIGYYPLLHHPGSVELRKMYLLSEARRKGLGRFLLQTIEQDIKDRGFHTIWLETASVLKEAVLLYEKNGYSLVPSELATTIRCDRVYLKQLQ